MIHAQKRYKRIAFRMIYYKEHSNHFNIVIAFHVTYKGPELYITVGNPISGTNVVAAKVRVS